jgi:hypothetical protein
MSSTRNQIIHFYIKYQRRGLRNSRRLGFLVLKDENEMGNRIERIGLLERRGNKFRGKGMTRGDD